MTSTATLAAQLAALQRQLDHATRPRAFDEGDQISAAHSRADATLQRLGTQTPQPAPGETAERYRQRLLAKMQQYSSLAANPLPIGTMTGVVLDQIEAKIYADAQNAARNPQVKPGELRAVKERDAAGRLITTYVGDAMSWRAAFTAPGVGCVLPRP